MSKLKPASDAATHIRSQRPKPNIQASLRSGLRLREMIEIVG